LRATLVHNALRNGICVDKIKKGVLRVFVLQGRQGPRRVGNALNAGCCCCIVVVVILIVVVTVIVTTKKEPLRVPHRLRAQVGRRHAGGRKRPDRVGDGLRVAVLHQPARRHYCVIIIIIVVVIDIMFFEAVQKRRILILIRILQFRQRPGDVGNDGWIRFRDGPFQKLLCHGWLRNPGAQAVNAIIVDIIIIRLLWLC